MFILIKHATDTNTSHGGAIFVNSSDSNLHKTLLYRNKNNV